MTSRQQAAGWMLVAALSAATMAACIRSIRADVDWRIITFARALLGLLIAWGMLARRGEAFPWRPPRQQWIRSGCGAIAFLCTFYAVTKIPVADALVLLNSSPLWVALFAAVFLGQRLSGRTAVALVVGTAGVIVIAQPHFAHRNLGALAGVATGVLMAVSVLSIARIKGISTMAMVAHTTAGAVISSGVALLAGLGSVTPDALRSPRVIAVIVAIALLGTLCQIGITRAYATPGGARFAALQYSVVVFGAGLDFVLFGQGLSPSGAVGIVLVVAPILWLTLGRTTPGELRRRELTLAPAAWGDGSVRDRLRSLEDAVRSAEKQTSCEVRIHVERDCADAKRVPNDVFRRLGMERTRLRNGVLIYLALDSRTFAVVVDEGIADGIPPRLLDELCDTITADMHARDPIAAVGDGIVRLFTVLGDHFPYRRDDVNELPDEISFGAGF